MNDSSSLLRAVRGPILLIALGVLFVLDQHSGSMAFYRTWPILLILMGLFRLAERMTARPQPVPPMGGGWTQPPPPPPDPSRPWNQPPPQGGV
ncbi:MAG: DUF5668 domain-containing protein [Bryobacteraceae bacterium]|nr:DUF5668 domain-containing protein [Bryobacteraceae bacterium]